MPKYFFILISIPFLFSCSNENDIKPISFSTSPDQLINHQIVTSISQNNSTTSIETQSKNIDSLYQLPTIESTDTVFIQPSGNLVKIPFNNISNITSSFNIEQNCSTQNYNYLLVDSSLQHFLNDNFSSGSFLLKNGKYQINSNLIVYIYSTPLSSLSLNSNSSSVFNCLNNKSLSFNNYGSGNLILNNLNIDFLDFKNYKNSNININGSNIQNLNLINYDSGKIDLNSNVFSASLSNISSGSIFTQNIFTINNINNSPNGNISIKNITIK